MALGILTDYLSWHYGAALRERLREWLAIVRVVASFFSLAPLAKTLFAPWHRIREPYGRGFSPTEFLSALVVNLFSRLVGAFVRASVILIGLAALAAAAAVGAARVIAWLAGPAITLALALAGALLVAS